MSVNFFCTNCKEPVRNDSVFGLCDDQIQTKAYSTTESPDKWNATVRNELRKEVAFTPLDKCLKILKPGTADEESLCDGMLTFDNSLYLVELKDKGKRWKEDAKDQLTNTIRLLKEHHPDFKSTFRYLKAYPCNRKHPHFAVIDNAEQKEFMKITDGFRLDVNALITLR
mgnify:CR=1 FL=1|jgi:hypothetical protein